MSAREGGSGPNRLVKQMKLGCITDIHEHIEHLRLALDLFRREGVDQVVVIGDVFGTGEQMEETCRLLAEAKAVGVWGNHDFALCVDGQDASRGTYPAVVTDYMASLRPKLVLGDCHFAHVEPWLDPADIADLWYCEGPPDEQGKLARIFEAVPERLIFAGHYHRWLLARPESILSWKGEAPVRLFNARYFVVVGALCEGRFAVFDTETSELTPYHAAVRSD